MAPRLLPVAIAAWAATLLSRPLAENDLFWHLMLGRAVAGERSRTVIEPSAIAWTPGHTQVPEWLWDLFAWGSYSAGGGAGLTLFVMACGALAAALVAVLVRSEMRGAHPWAIAAATALVAGAMAVRFKERPETLALGLGALFLMLSRRVVRSARWQWVALLLAVEVLWAQVHGTFVLALPFFLASALDARWRAARRLAAVSGAVALALVTGPSGLQVSSFIAEHLQGDSVRHIIDMQAPVWESFEPLAHPSAVVISLLTIWCLAAALAGYGRRRSLVLLLLGVGVGLASVRGVSVWALCVVPQLALALRWVLRSRRRPLMVAVSLAALLTLVAVTVRTQRRTGPFFAFQVRQSELPFEAMSALAPLPDGAVLWTSYGIGAAVGLLSEGRLRVTIDSRTPLHFAAADFALSRDCRTNLACFDRAVAALSVKGAVVERGPECDMVARHGGFVPVAVNARYATFARPLDGVVPLKTIDPCAPLYLAPSACGPDFDADLAHLASAGEDFIFFLGQLRLAQCGGRPDVKGLEALLAKYPHWPALRVTTGVACLRAGDALGGARRLATAVEQRFTPGLKPLLEALSALGPEERRELLDELVVQLDDDTPGALRALRATTAAEQNDDVVAKSEALRAAAAGQRTVMPLLRALAQVSDVKEDRDRYAAWLRVLEAPDATTPTP